MRLYHYVLRLEKRFQLWLQQRQAAAVERAYQNGLEYAEEVLEKGEYTADEVYALSDGKWADNPEEEAFDRGCRDYAAQFMQVVP